MAKIDVIAVRKVQFNNGDAPKVRLGKHELFEIRAAVPFRVFPGATSDINSGVTCDHFVIVIPTRGLTAPLTVVPPNAPIRLSVFNPSTKDEVLYETGEILFTAMAMTNGTIAAE